MLKEPLEDKVEALDEANDDSGVGVIDLFGRWALARKTGGFAVAEENLLLSCDWVVCFF